MCALNPVNTRHIEEFLGSFSISVIIKDLQNGCEWMFTGVYGPASPNNREAFWEELKGLRHRWDGPWVIGGDFNVIRFINEKNIGGQITRSMRDFEDFVRGSFQRYSSM